jgi:NADH-quinone oxidoreductase subunit F
MSTRLTSKKMLEDLRQEIQKSKDPKQPVIALCGGTGCQACGCRRVLAAIQQEIATQKLEGKLRIHLTGCQLLCERGPLVIVHPHGHFYQRVKPEDAAELCQAALTGKAISRLQYIDLAEKHYLRQEDVPFYQSQMRLLTQYNGLLDPTRIEDYIGVGGYAALATVLTSMKPEQVIADITKSGLRGRGGGGFPAGVKWESCRQAPSSDGVRYLIGNGDEGDPGAFMDRSLMEDNAHMIIEGMAIGAYAIGTPGKPVGYLYVRNEYPLALERLASALQQARAYGLLGENILGSELNFDITINRGGGAFVCGESTALMASIEGAVGEPRAKHIHTVVAGLWDKPTNLNNVETWANVPLIINRGVDWFTSIGTGDVRTDPWGGSKGTKIFALVGKVNNTGLVEVPMGVSLRKIIFDIGGGIRDGRKFKAVQTGGPSGGCLPESLLDLKVDFDQLTEVGSMMGSGGMIVMDERTCMVDVARYFLHFLADESCGKCVTCREGLVQLCAIVDRVCAGNAREGDIALMEELGETVADASLCALGQTAPNPLRSTLRYFREEYEEHVHQQKCRARVCKSLIRFSVIPEKCIGCLLCKRKCPSLAVSGEAKEVHVIDQSKCIKCGVCEEVCRYDAIAVE